MNFKATIFDLIWHLEFQFNSNAGQNIIYGYLRYHRAKGPKPTLKQVLKNIKKCVEK